MQITRTLTVAASMAAPALLALTLLPSAASAHGTMNNPASRTMFCFQEGPESPRTDVCKATVQLGGTQPLYDWNEVNIGDVNGRHRERIPDGKLCSAGRDKYRGFDQARADWPATHIKSGPFSFDFRATAPHRSTFELYITKPGYNPAQPLKWSDLEATPFHRETDPALSGGSYRMDAQIPARTGRHLIYVVQQRNDSPEAFYSCSDVVFS
ncbi:lytic polysaccharide monooxygenase [Nonomuraea longicatena]|uniref:Chitin-binding type-4 domain-containing protein n=1 Tax=Nonomuraea longicatena TaxID=83682 RepID=A0ABP3Z1M9_9ACTN